MTMRELTYQVSFNTPAFLGNAEQQAQWRTPPFKAMLRQWWRVVKAPDVGYDYRRLLKLENELFGSAGDDNGGGRSKVQLRLSGWYAGTLADLPPLATHLHPDVKDRQTGQLRPVGTGVYLGFGPVTTQGSRKAIAADGPAITFKLRVPNTEAHTIQKTMQLAAWFGTLGSRSRNAWGSLHIEGDGVLGWGNYAIRSWPNSQPCAPWLTHWGTAWPPIGPTPWACVPTADPLCGGSLQAVP